MTPSLSRPPQSLLERQASTITKLRSKSKKGFVLIPENDLLEIRALEGALRHERALLKAHCLVSLNEGEVHTVA